MANYELISFDNPLALAQAAADAWITKIAAASHHDSRARVALSGGRIARHFFSAVAECAKKRAVSFAHAHFFWADERCVPPREPESNFALAQQWLFEPLQVASNQIHRVRGEIQPEEAAREAAAELRRVAPANAVGQPVLEVVFLGLGEDGHVASLFPDMPLEKINCPDVYQAVTAVKPPPRRITLTYAAISAAQEVWVLASGPGKAEALQASLIPGAQTPLGRVLGLRQQTRIFSDIHLGAGNH